MLFGSQIFGWIGDSYGRKTALIPAISCSASSPSAAAYSTNLTRLFWLRFIAGLGIGGVIPNVVAINAESAPRNLRATLAIIAIGTVPIGGALAGFASAALVPTLWLADPVPDRRHRSDRLCDRRHVSACRNRSNS